MIYVQLLSGKVYSYEAEFVLQLLLNLERDLFVSHRHIKLFLGEERVYTSDHVVDGSTYFAFIERTGIADILYFRVIDGEFMTFRPPVQVLMADCFDVVFSSKEFTSEIIEKLRLEIWESEGIDTTQMSLSRLVEEYVTRVRKLEVRQVIAQE